MMTVEVLQQVPFFSRLDEGKLADIAARAGDVQLEKGEWLSHEGEVAAFFVILFGKLDVLKTLDGSTRVYRQYGPGDFTGEVPLLLGAAALASLRAAEPCRLARLDAATFRELIAGDPELSPVILKTMSERVELVQKLVLEESPPAVTVVGDRWEMGCHEVRNFLARNHVPYAWLEPGQAVSKLGLPADEVRGFCPLVVLADGRRLQTPTLRQLAERVGLQTRPRLAQYDLGIVGAGPAGLAAAVYGASEGLSTVVFEEEAPGGQAGTSSRIQNYLGFPAGLSGDELADRALQQARGFGAEFLVARTVHSLRFGEPHVVLLDGDEPVPCRSVVIACGVSWRHLDLPNVPALLGKGVYYGTARTDALVSRGKDVYIVGGGNSAGQAAIFLSGFARQVSLVVRSKSLAQSMSQYLMEQLATRANIRVEVETEVIDVHGDEHLTSVSIRRQGQEETRPAGMLFILIGGEARTGWLPPALARDDDGYILTGRDLPPRSARGRDPFMLETSVPGVFAAGDVRHGSMKRVASGVGEGSMAIAFVHHYLAVPL